MKKIWRSTLMAICLMVAVSACNRKPSSGSEDETSDFTAPSDSMLLNEYPFDTSVAGVFVRRDGSVSSVDAEDFKSDYYDVEEFEKDYAVPAVVAYNQNKQGLAFSKASETDEKLGVAIKDINLKQGKLSLQLDYATASDYLEFNKKINDFYGRWETFTVCRYSELKDLGISVNTEFVDTEGNTVSVDTVNQAEGLYACVLGTGGELPSGFSGEFQFQGAVVYTSPEVYVQSANTVRIYGSESLQIILFQ